MRRFKLMALLLVVCFSSQKLFAQDLQLGLTGGLNYNIFPADNGTVNGLGFHLGATADIGVSDMLNFRAGLILSDRGIQEKSTLELLGSTTKIKSNSLPLYLTIPLMYKYQTGSLSFFAGPQFSLLLTNRVAVQTTVNGDEVTKTVVSGSDATNGMRGFTYGVTAGAEYGLNDNLGVGLRYIRDLNSTTDSDLAEDFFNGIQLSFIYKL